MKKSMFNLLGSITRGLQTRRRLGNQHWIPLAAATAGLLLVSSPTVLAASPSTADEKAEALLKEMTLEEKIGQMTQVDTDALKDKSHIQKYFLGSVLSGGGSDPSDNSPQGWLKLANECQGWAGKTRLKIPLLYGVDAVHGHNNVLGAVIFPHNIGLGATRNPALVEQAARITALEVAGTGINWTFAPCVAVAQDPRWGRTYESFTDSPELAGQLGEAALIGFQGRQFTEPGSVMGCVKHYVGDGGTKGGVDQGDTVVDESTLRSIHLAPYVAPLRAGAGSVMASFSSWNGKKMHGHKYLLTDVLKGELGFRGFVVSDWAGIDQLPHDFKGNIEAAINAGMDMAMVPNGPGQKNNYIEYVTHLKDLVKEGRVPISRIDDAVRRILRAKIEAGVFEQKATDPALTAAIGSEAHRAVARDCVRQSLVVLKNENALPLNKKVRRLTVVGKAADDLGMQCGGWTISWQGESGKVTPGGTTLLEAIRKSVSPDTVVTFSPDGLNLEPADAIIVALGEVPYAEGKGDRADLRLPEDAVRLVARARKAGAPVTTVLFSGRPLILGEAFEASDAVVAAWLPGTEGLGLTDVLFGDFQPTGKLPRPWPRGTNVTSADLKVEGEVLRPFGFGLSFREPEMAPAKATAAKH